MAQEKDEDKGSDMTSHEPGTGKGEETSSRQGKEPGRFDKEDDEKGRPSGGSTARDSTSVNEKAAEPIDPAMPNMPPA